MDTFKRIRSGISELKREKDELKTKYDFLAGELSRLVQANSNEIKAVATKAMAGAESIAGAEEKINKMEKTVGEAEGRVLNEISALKKHSEDYKKALIEVGERLQHAQDSADEANKWVEDNREQGKSLSKYMDDMGKRISDLASLRERIKEIEKAGDVLVKGVQDLEELRGSVAGIQEKIAGLDSSLADRAALTESKLSSDIASMQHEVKSNSLAIKGTDSAMEKTTLDLQSIRHDIVAEHAGIARVRGTAANNRKKLELLGTLQSQIKNIESIKAGLVKGVESLRGMANKIVALEQKTRDLDARLTNADKALEAKVLEKATGLDRQISEKTGAMESQMQDRLKFLEANLTEKGRTMETRLVDMHKQFEGSASAELDGMKKEIGKEMSDTKKLRLDLQKMNASLRDLKSSSAGSKSGVQEIKKALSSVSSRVNSLEALRERVKVIEDAKDALIAGMGDLADVKEGVGVLDEKSKSLEERISGEAGALRSDMQKAIAGLKADQSATKKKVASLENLRQKTRDIERLEKSLSARLREIKPVQGEVAALRHDLESNKREMDNTDSVLESKMDYNTSSLKKESAFNAASLAKLDEELRGFSLDLHSMKKDWQAGHRDVSETRTAMANAQKRIAELEKLQIRLKEMENTKEALSNAMDARLEEKMKFLETSLRQKGENIEAGLQERSKAIETKVTKLNSTIAGVKKEVASLQSLQELQAGMDERARNLDKDVRELRSGLARELAGLRGQIESAKTGGRDKFDSAVKAFLNTRGEISSKMNGMNIKMSELEKRMNEFSRTLIRMDLLEKKLDRVTERSTEMRRDMDKLESKEESGEKITVVDLEKEGEEI